MPIMSIVCGGLLIALSAWGYNASETKSITIFIPAGVGGLLVLLGLIGLVERLLKHAMHAAAMIGLLGAVAAGYRFVPKLLEGADWNDLPMRMTGKMFLVCVIFVAMCINSFIQARRRRAAKA
jgi:hypothetical protein